MIKFLENFSTISGHFCRFHKDQDTENAPNGQTLGHTATIYEPLTYFTQIYISTDGW